MNTARNSQADLIDRYVRQLHVRRDETRQWYANEIRAFYRFLVRTTPDGLPTEAAAAEKPTKAFAALPKPAPWSSSLGPIMRDHVVLMRAVGYRYRAQEERNRAFDRFLQSRPDLARQPLDALIEAWTGATPTKAHAGQCELALLGRGD